MRFVLKHEYRDSYVANDDDDWTDDLEAAVLFTLKLDSTCPGEVDIQPPLCKFSLYTRGLCVPLPVAVVRHAISMKGVSDAGED